MTDRLAASSYPADDALLDELRASWPPTAPEAATGRGDLSADESGSAPVSALRLSDRFAIALVPARGGDGSFRVVPLTRDETLITSWRQAAAGHGLSAYVAGVPMASERAIEADQTNASVVVGERVIVKWFRRIGPGPARATRLQAHLEAVGFREMPAPLGALSWTSPSGAELTIAQGDAFLSGARDGWDWAVERLERHVGHGEAACPAGCDPWIGDRLGRLVVRLHAALRTASAAIPDPGSVAGRSVVAGWRDSAHATLADALRLTADQDPDAGVALTAIEPAMRAELDLLPIGRPIEIWPVHGDFHVGQILEWSGGLAVIDFDGNPTLGAGATPSDSRPSATSPRCCRASIMSGGS